VATRAASGTVLDALAPVLPELWGGSADLAGSNNTTMTGQPSFLPTARSSAQLPGQPYGRTLHFGIREHAMGAILSGIALHGLTRPYGGTFFQFADYMRGAVRLAALMQASVVYVWTHDSIGLGEDGPTHQPVEHLAAYRAIPGLAVVRPADANETAAAWAEVLRRDDGPAALVLTRQDVPTFPRGTDGYAPVDVARGAYTLLDAHLARLARAAAHFNRPLELARIQNALAQHAREHPAGLRKARLLVAENGALTLESSETADIPSPQTATLAEHPVLTSNDFLYHKTTHRSFLDNPAQSSHRPCFTILHWNERNELTEFTTGNLVLEIDGEKLTPPVASGLLPGVMREDLLRRGEIRERILHIADLARATRIWFINSVRGWIEIVLSPRDFLP